MMNEKVFKLPDGKGGWIMKIQDETGAWLECDEQGNPVYAKDPKESPKQETESPLIEPSISQRTGKARAARPSAGKKQPKGLQFGIKIPEDLFNLVTEYVGWKGFIEHRAVHRSEVFIQGAAELIGRDKAFKAFRDSMKKKNERP